MKITSTRSRLMASTIILGAAMALATAGQASAQSAPEGSPQPTPNVSNASSAPVNAPAGQTQSSPSTIGTQESTTQPAAAAGATVSEVTVTGSRIRSPNLTSTSPLTVVNSQELKLQGTTNVETLLANLPSAYTAQSSQVSNGSNGTAQANLRNLGPTRTLVLVDGKRLMPGDPAYSGNAPVPDLNNIPAALVDRVDVITGGASAVYGSDAVAGVVNFILKKNFEGVQIDAQTGFANHQNGNKAIAGPLAAFGIKKPGDVDHDGNTNDVSIILGASAPDGKGNITAYATYRNLQPVLQSSRDFSACGLSASSAGNANNIYDHHICQGSSNSAYGRFGGFGNNPDGSKTFVKYNGALAFNFAPFNFLQREDDRYTAGFFGHYQVAKWADLYSDFMFADDHTTAQIAPSGLFRGTGAFGGSTFAINCDNPLIGDAVGPTGMSQRQTLCGANAGTPTVTNQIIGYRFAGFPRQDDLRHTDYKIDLGLRGDFAPGWSYDAYLQYGTAILAERYLNDTSTAKIQNGLLVSNVNGVPTCQSVINGTDPNCVPLDLFTSLGRTLTKAAINYVATPGLQSGTTIEQIASASVTGDLGQQGIRSPFATDGLGVAFGTEYRREQLNLSVDNEYATGDLSGQGGPRKSVNGTFDVYELFGEARLPIVEDRPFIKELSIDGGYRYSNYSLSGNTSAYKVEGNYAPTRDIRLRLGYNRAVRAPNAQELFTPATVNLGGFQDPCANDPGGKPTASPAACANTGVTAGQYGTIPTCPSAQCSILVGGNTALKPEVADTYTAGLVFTPSFFHGFTASLDYFDIKVNGLISSVPANTSLTQCLAGNQTFCALIKRDPATGIIFGQTGYVSQLDINTGFLHTQGVDLQADYKVGVPTFGHGDFGSLAFSFVGTYTGLFQQLNVPGVGSYNCVGKFGITCGFPQPHFRSELRSSWITPYNVTLSLNWRFLGDSKLDLNDKNPILNGGIVDTTDAKIPNYSYFDLAATWRVRDHFTLRAGINNIADKDPPILDSNNFGISAPPFGNANTYPGEYDSLGRTVFVGVTADF